MFPNSPAELRLPFYDAAIPAGFPSPANDYLEESINLNEEFIRHPLSTFLISTEGDSMIEAFIPHRSILLVDRSIKPQNGDIVVAVLNGEFTVKYLERTSKRCRLVPANEKFEPIEVTEEMQMQIWGVVIKIFIDPKDVRNVCASRL